MLYTTIDKDNISKFVLLFYTNVIKDKAIGHFFTDILGNDLNNKQWKEHIDILTDFWAAMILGEDNYTGSPFAPHSTMKLHKKDFDQWMSVLSNTLDTLYEYQTAQPYRQIGAIMSKNFLKNLDG